MSRIRSIKPEFWRDEKIASLKNKLAGYFFIGLWNVADDTGKFPLSPKALALELPIFRSKEVVTYLSELSQKGLIKKSECSQWGLITNWHHQKIDRPRVPKIKNEDIQWVKETDSTISREASTSIRRKDRIGSRIGSDRIKDRGDGSTNRRNDLVKIVDESGKNTADLIALYCDLWKSRYGASAPITPQVSGMLKNFLKSQGWNKSEKYLSAYLDMADSWFLTKRHDIPTFLANLNAVAQFAETGRLVSKTEIQNADQTIATKNLIRDIERNGI